MAGVMECPSCGESERLRGEPHDGDIRVACLACGAQWMRGAPRCASCGGADIVERPQAMTRHSRGTQLSIIGWRELPLCRTCDADALETSVTENTPVPSDYVANCLYGHGGRPEARSPSQAAATTPPPVADPPAPVPERQKQPPRPVVSPPARPRPQHASPASSMVPTVRQAIAAFLAEASGEVDHTAMLLLGTHLGSYNRLGMLDEPDAADKLAAWCEGHWAQRKGGAAERALGTIVRAVDFWGARGWLASDPAARLR